MTRLDSLWYQIGQEVKMSRKFIFIVMFLFMVGSVCALGITPGRTTLDFQPGLKSNVNFDIINSGDTDLEFVLSVQGELAEYVSVSSSAVSISASEHSKTFSYSVSLPEDMEPGLHTAEVFVMQVPEGGEASGFSVLATLAVVTQLYVYVPYPGKFAVSNMVVYNANQGEDVTFVFPVVSRGEFDLTSVKANVDIYNSLNEKIDSFVTSSLAIPSGEKKEIIYNWKANVPIGDYRGVATVIYDEGVINLEETFSVGNKELELQEISVSGFSLGQIAKLEMLVENKWSEPISGVHVATKIMNERGDIVSTFESAAYDVAALAKQVFVSYWDTAGVREGNYQTEVSINYGDKSSKKNLEFQVKQNELIIVGLGYVISAENGGGTSNLVVILIIVIVVLVLINLLWFFLLRKRLVKK